MKAGVERHLVRAPGDNHRADALPREGHFKGFRDRDKVEELGVEVDGGEGSRGYDNALKVLENALDSEGCVEACEIQERVWNVGEALIKGLDDDLKTLRVGRDEVAKVDNDRDWLVRVDVDDLERVQERL